MRIEVLQELDELGEPEQFTWDLFPIVDSSKTLHLDQNGLPKAGTYVRPGMIVVGKIGKTAKWNPSSQPSALEIHGSHSSELNRKYGAMWKDSSLYATESLCGIVERAYLEDTPSGLRAVVELTPTPASADGANMPAAAAPR